MTGRLPADPAPGPLEDYSARFDDLFDTLAGRATSLSPLPGRATATHRAKQDLLTALANNTEPMAGAQRKEAQGLFSGSSRSRAGARRR